MTSLTRRYRFSAAHVLAREEWSPERNGGVFGKCANPAGHGHNYELLVTVAGEADRESGMLVPARVLDRAVRERVVAKLDGRLLLQGGQGFEDRVPTAENIARFAWEALAGRLDRVQLERVRLVETTNNAVEFDGEER
ncbi:MAG: 6-carboxytetrahydropterin synthase [Myxococcota bacterium]